jgi:hypothetical protein
MVTLKEHSVTAKIIDLGLEKTLDESASNAGLVMVNLGGVEIGKGETTVFVTDMSLAIVKPRLNATRKITSWFVDAATIGGRRVRLEKHQLGRQADSRHQEQKFGLPPFRQNQRQPGWTLRQKERPGHLRPFNNPRILAGRRKSSSRLFKRSSQEPNTVEAHKRDLPRKRKRVEDWLTQTLLPFESGPESNQKSQQPQKDVKRE